MADYLIIGVGGQGIVLSSRLLAQAAIARDLDVRTAETIGMSQRGGQVTSHVRCAAKVYSPMISRGQADVLLAFEPAEAARSLPFVKPGGSILCLTDPVWPVTSSLKGKPYDFEACLRALLAHNGRVALADPTPLSEKFGSRRFINVALLGTALREGFVEFSEEDLLNAIRLLVKPQFLETNLAAFAEGVTVTRKNY